MRHNLEDEIPICIITTDINGQLYIIDAPGCEETGATAEMLFEQACNKIAAQLLARNRAEADKHEWAQRVCYDFITKMLIHGHDALLNERIIQFNRRLGLSNEYNPFYRGLMAIFAHEPGLIDDKQRGLFAKRLWYAYRHYVPPCFVIGFLREFWPDVERKRVALDSIQPQLEEWIWFERAKDTARKFRGPYPADLDEKVDGATLIIPIVAKHQKRLRKIRNDRETDDYFEG